MRCWIVFAFLFFAGCARLAPGQLPADSTSTKNIFLIRGYLDWYSTGIDRLKDELRAEGWNAVDFREEQWGDLQEAIARHPRQPINLIGFSYGADDVILIARHLSQQKIPVNLLITIDPVTPAAIPPNVRCCVNYYQSNGFWDVFPWLRGVPVHGDNCGHIQNIDIRADPQLLEPDTSHRTIAQNENIHHAIMALFKNNGSFLRASDFPIIRNPIAKVP